MMLMERMDSVYDERDEEMIQRLVCVSINRSSRQSGLFFDKRTVDIV